MSACDFSTSQRGAGTTMRVLLAFALRGARPPEQRRSRQTRPRCVVEARLTRHLTRSDGRGGGHGGGQLEACYRGDRGRWSGSRRFVPALAWRWWLGGCASAPRPMIDSSFAARAYTPARITVLPPDVFIVVDEGGDTIPRGPRRWASRSPHKRARRSNRRCVRRGYDVDFRWAGTASTLRTAARSSPRQLGCDRNGIVSFANQPRRGQPRRDADDALRGAGRGMNVWVGRRSRRRCSTSTSRARHHAGQTRGQRVRGRCSSSSSSRR